MSDSLIHSYFQ